MSLREEKKILKKLKSETNDFVKFLGKNLTVPENNFTGKTIYGIAKSKSCIARKIAKSLDGKVSVKKVTDNFRTQFSKPELHKEIRARILKKLAKKINRDTIIAVDDSDIIKPEAKKMEGLKLVPDGSNDHKRGLGYKLMNITAVKGDAEVIPLMSELFSDDIEIDTAKNVLFDQINDIQIASGNKGIFTFDRYYDDRKLYKYLYSNDADFIVKAKNIRKLYIDGNYVDFIDVAKSVKLNVTVEIKDDEEIEAGAVKVEVPVNPHKLKVPVTVSLWLIVGRFTKKPKKKRGKSEEKGGYFYLFVNIKHMNNDRKAIILKSLSGYKLRWKIEEFHRHVKQDFGWEKMQLMDYTRLKTMNILLLAAICLVYSMYKIRMILYQIFPNMMMDRKRDMTRKMFIYYRITDVVTYLLNSWKLRKRIKYKGKYADSLQLKLNLR